MNQKTIITILIAVGIVLFGTTIYFATIKQDNQLPAVVTPQATQQPPQQIANTPIQQNDNNSITNSANTIYSNQEYGFQITLTNNWKNYFIETKIDYNQGMLNVELNDPNHKRIKFYLETAHKECLFAIDIIDSKLKEEYEKDVSECEKEQKETGIAMYPCNTEIGSNDKYIFLGKVIVQDSTEQGSVALQDVSKIFKSFQLTK